LRQFVCAIPARGGRAHGRSGRRETQDARGGSVDGGAAALTAGGRRAGAAGHPGVADWTLGAPAG
jgi:hypothetical protein